MLLRRSLALSALQPLSSLSLRPASSFARDSADDSRPLKHAARKTEHAKQQHLKAERKRQSHDAVDLDSQLKDAPVFSEPLHNISTPGSYFVQRTPTRNLPVYQLRKRGGNLKQTLLRKISGRPEELLSALAETLQPAPEWLRVNPVNGHIEMKGWYKIQIEQFLRAKGF